MLSYKGYTGHAEFDNEGELFYGEVLDLRDVVTFQSRSVDELKKAFEASVDDYLEFCKVRGEEPDKLFSGKLMLRLPPSSTAKFTPHLKLRAEASISGLLRGSSGPSNRMPCRMYYSHVEKPKEPATRCAAQ